MNIKLESKASYAYARYKTNMIYSDFFVDELLTSSLDPTIELENQCLKEQSLGKTHLMWAYLLISQITPVDLNSVPYCWNRAEQTEVENISFVVGQPKNATTPKY